MPSSRAVVQASMGNMQHQSDTVQRNSCPPKLIPKGSSNGSCSAAAERGAQAQVRVKQLGQHMQHNSWPQSLVPPYYACAFSRRAQMLIFEFLFISEFQYSPDITYGSFAPVTQIHTGRETMAP